MDGCKVERAIIGEGSAIARVAYEETELDTIEPLGVQYYCTGTAPGHGDMMVKAVGVPVTVGGMTVMPGDMIHMDLHGSVKFPAEYLEEILIRAKKLLEDEAGTAAVFNDPGFSLEKWKKRVQGYETV